MNQILYIFGAIIVLGITTRSVNSLWLTKQETMYMTEAQITGNTLAQSLIDEIITRRFDENSSPDSTLTLSELVAPNILGTDKGENKHDSGTFDDIDDYDTYHRTVDTPRMGSFDIKCTVYYVAEAFPDKKLNARSFLKRIDILITNPYVGTPDNSITVSRIVSYRSN